MTIELIDQAAVCEQYGTSDSTIYRERIKPGSDFPKPVRVFTQSKRGRIRYVKAEVDEWFSRKLAESRVTLSSSQG
jgi:predicted DNA-binding transcriptional regulator AlpA